MFELVVDLIKFKQPIQRKGYNIMMETSMWTEIYDKLKKKFGNE